MFEPLPEMNRILVDEIYQQSIVCFADPTQERQVALATVRDLPIAGSDLDTVRLCRDPEPLWRLKHEHGFGLGGSRMDIEEGMRRT